MIGPSSPLFSIVRGSRGRALRLHPSSEPLFSSLLEERGFVQMASLTIWRHRRRADWRVDLSHEAHIITARLYGRGRAALWHALLAEELIGVWP